MDEQRDLNDSGYGSGTPAKRARIESALGDIPKPLIDEIECGFNEVYLIKPGSLVASYKQGVQPPIMNSPIKMVQALKVSPGHSSGLRVQIDRMNHYCRFPVDQDHVEVVDLTTNSN